MGILSNLEPKPVFSIFEQLCAIPHGSGNTAQISAFCRDFARSRGLDARQDASGNLLIRKAASPGRESEAGLILQAHLDMVCAQTADCGKDLRAEGLDLATDGEWVWANGTSLGGDNGAGVAMILALLESDTPCPPLEAILTVDEETGMDGAFALDCTGIQGRRLLNLDSEEEGVFTVSCAGGVRADCLLPCARVSCSGETGFRIRISGLRGGHSGCDIHRGRASANQLCGRFLYAAFRKLDGLRLAELSGGLFDNVICAEADALLAVPPEKAALLQAFAAEFSAALQAELAVSDPGVCLDCRPAPLKDALSEADTRRVLQALVSVPQGVEAMSSDFPGLVQTSMNLGVLELRPEGLAFSCSIRSSLASQKTMLLERLEAIVNASGGQVSTRSAYPGWPYARSSPLRDSLSALWQNLYGKKPLLSATHGGLECGLLLEKLPGLDILSLGPDLENVHSPAERLNVSSVRRVYRLLEAFLEHA